MRDFGQTYISVPAYSVPAMTKVLATPLMPSAKAPGSSQYLKPIFWGPMPPAEMQMARMKKMEMEMTLILQSVSGMETSSGTENLQRQPVLNFSVRKDTEHTQRNKECPEDEDPRPLRHHIGPVHDDKRDGIVLVGQDLLPSVHGPTKKHQAIDSNPEIPIRPAQSERQGRINEAASIVGEGAGNGNQGGQFSEGLPGGDGQRRRSPWGSKLLHNEKDDDADQREADEDASWAGETKSISRTDEKTRSDDAWEGVSVLSGMVRGRVSVC